MGCPDIPCGSLPCSDKSVLRKPDGHGAVIVGLAFQQERFASELDEEVCDLLFQFPVAFCGLALCQLALRSQDIHMGIKRKILAESLIDNGNK